MKEANLNDEQLNDLRKRRNARPAPEPFSPAQSELDSVLSKVRAVLDRVYAPPKNSDENVAANLIALRGDVEDTRNNLSDPEKRRF